MKQTPRDIVDMFVADVLLPSTDTKKHMTTHVLYDYYKQYCDYAEVDPVAINQFGKCLGRRLIKSRRQGKMHFLCELNPRVAKEE